MDQDPSRKSGYGRATEVIIISVVIVSVISILHLPCEKVSGNRVPTVIFEGRAAFFHSFIIAMNFALCGAVVTLFLRDLYPTFARWTRRLSVAFMAFAVAVLFWSVAPLLISRVPSMAVENWLAMIFEALGV